MIETYHIGDNGQSENVHELDNEKLKERTVVPIDIANDPVNDADSKKDEDPANFVSEKTGRGPLKGDWIVRFKSLDFVNNFLLLGLSPPCDDLLQAGVLPDQVGPHPEQAGELHPGHLPQTFYTISPVSMLPTTY